MADSKLETLDSNMKTGVVTRDAVEYHSPDEAPFRLTGFPFRKPGERFRRMPDDPKFPDGARILGQNSAGGQVAFRSDSGHIRLKVKASDVFPMYHMPSTGSQGFDLYLGEPGHRRMNGLTRQKPGDTEFELDMLKEVMPGKMREFLIHFPLYSNVDSLEIGLTPGCRIEPPTPWNDPRPVVYYGTSITQGGCASRPGMCDSNILSRKWNIPVLNFGFSGSGKGEPIVIEQLAKVPDPRLFILDYVANAWSVGIEKTLSGAIDILRKAHPSVPIAVMTAVRDSQCTFRDFVGPFDFQQEADEVARRRAAGDDLVHLVRADQPFDEDWDEQTVDGCHLTDYGFAVKAKRIAPQLEAIMGMSR